MKQHLKLYTAKIIVGTQLTTESPLGSRLPPSIAATPGLINISQTPLRDRQEKDIDYCSVYFLVSHCVGFLEVIAFRLA